MVVGLKCSSYAIGADLYNHVLTGDVTMTLCCERADSHHIPCVIVGGDGIVISENNGTINGEQPSR